MQLQNLGVKINFLGKIDVDDEIERQINIIKLNLYIYGKEFNLCQLVPVKQD